MLNGLGCHNMSDQDPGYLGYVGDLYRDYKKLRVPMNQPVFHGACQVTRVLITAGKKSAPIYTLQSSGKCWYTLDGTLNDQPHIHLI